MTGWEHQQAYENRERRNRVVKPIIIERHPLDRPFCRCGRDVDEPLGLCWACKQQHIKSDNSGKEVK